MKILTKPYYDVDDGIGGGGEPTPKSIDEYTLDEFLALKRDNQAEFDRRLNKGITTAVENATEKLNAQHTKELTEREKLAQMNAEEKQKYEIQQKLDEIARKEKEITRRELLASASATLAEKHLPLDLVNLVDCSSAESVKASIDAIETTWSQTVQGAVEDRLKGGSLPKTSGSAPALTKEDIFKIENTAERQKAISENLHLFT